MTRDALVIGGGLAGATLAIKLAEAGRDVVLLEKTAGPEHKMCGEFFSQEALHYLGRLDLDLASLGAVPIDRVRLVRRETLAEAPLPFQARSLSRRVLDEALLARAQAAGATVLRGRRVAALSAEESGWTAQLNGEDPNTQRARSAFLATGKLDLHGWQRAPGRQNDLVAFKMYFRLADPQHGQLRNAVELILFPGGYAGLQPVENGLANLCLLVTRARLKLCGSRWETLLDHMAAHSPHLLRRLDAATPMLARPIALSRIPYGLLPAPTASGLWRLGDQAAVIPSFSGDGMSIALHSAHLAAALYLEGRSPEAYTTQLRTQLGPGVRLATTLSRLLVGAPFASQIARFWPGLLRTIVTATRIPTGALLG